MMERGITEPFTIDEISFRRCFSAPSLELFVAAAPLWWPPGAKMKPRGMAYKKKSELALELIHLTHSWMDGDRVIRVVTDLGRPTSLKRTSANQGA